MLISRRLLLMSAFSTLQIPNFKAAAIADQDDLAFQFDFLAKIFRQNEAALLVSGAVLGSRMQLSEKNAAIARGNVRVGFGRRAHTRKFFRRHDQKKLVSRFRKNDEFLGVTASPARGNGDPILLVDEVTKLAGVEALVRRMHWRVEMFAILTHFSPLLTTFRASRQ
jgi:hypothetical protein